MKLVRWLGFLVLALIVLVAAAAVILPLVVDPNDYKDEITAVVKEQTGRDLRIEGDLKLSVFPWLGIETGELSLSNAPGFGDTPFASLQDAEVRVMLLPLLSKKVEASTVVLNGLTLNLARAANGHTNWDDLVKPAAEQPQAAPEPGKSGAPALAALAIGGVSVENARVVWDDQQAGARYEVKDLDLTLGEIVPGEPIDFDLAVKLEASEPQLDGGLQLQGVLGFSEDLKRFQLSDLTAKLDAKGPTLPGGALSAKLTTAVTVDLDKQTLAIPSLVAETLDLTLKASVQGEAIQSEAPRFSGKLAVNEFVPRELLHKLKIELPEMSDPTVLGKADLGLDFAATTSSADIRNLQLRFDASTLSGKLAVSDFARQSLRFDLALDEIDVDRYLPPPPPDAPKAAPTPAEAAAAGAGSLPLDTLRALDVAGTLRIAKLKAYQLRSSDVRVTIKAANGVIRVHPAEARMYDGQYQGDITLNVKGKQPRIALNESVSGVQVGPLLKDMLGEEKLLGRVDLTAKLNGRGADPQSIQKTLNGKVAFGFHEGAIKGINVAQLLREANAKLKGQPVPKQSGPNQTDFSELTGTARIKKGIVTNNDLSLLSPLLRVSGKGTVDLPRQTQDYLLTTKIVGSLQGQGGKDLKDLKGIAIPVRIKGSFAEPKFKVELDKVLKDAVKKKAQKKLDKKKDELKNKLEDQFKGKLDGLLK